MNAQLTKFDINMSKRDLLTKVSAFNPFPDKATGGILVSRIYHPMTNPARWIKYLATGQIYYVHQPLSYEITEIPSPEETTEDKVPNYSGDMWMSLDEFMSNLSLDLVRGECFSRASIDPSIERAVVSYFTDAGLPIFHEPKEAHIEIIKEALRLLESDPYTAWCFVDYACRTGAYTIKGTHFSEPSYGVFEYTGRELAWKACPSLLIFHRSEFLERGKWNILNDTAHEVQGYVILSISLMALRKLETKYTGTAHDHILVAIADIQDRLQNVAEKLVSKRDLVFGNYLNQALRYLHSNGINL